MLAKITKSYQFEDEKDYEKFVSGSFEAIMKHARSLIPLDSEEGYTIDFDHRGPSDIMKDGIKVGVDQGENKISLVHWVLDSSTITNEQGEAEEEPDYYWKFVVDVQFVADVVEECKDEVVAI